MDQVKTPLVSLRKLSAAAAESEATAWCRESRRGGAGTAWRCESRGGIGGTPWRCDSRGEDGETDFRWRGRAMQTSVLQYGLVCLHGDEAIRPVARVVLSVPCPRSARWRR